MNGMHSLATEDLESAFVLHAPVLVHAEGIGLFEKRGCFAQ